MSHFHLSPLAAVLVSASALLPVPAHASPTFTGVACASHGTAMINQPGFVNCSGAWSGNNRNQPADVVSLIFSEWGLNALPAQDICVENRGTLKFAAQTGLFVIALKAGNAFSLYEFDGASVAGGISSISPDTLGVGFFSGRDKEHFGQGLSHADLYAVAAPVPEPASAALLIAGLGLVGFMTRRRRS